MDPIIVIAILMKYFFLTITFQIKHFLADYPLQNEYMLGKFKPGWDFLKPLAAHTAVHGLFTLTILFVCCAWLNPATVIALTILDMVIHFAMDRIKASPNYLGKFQSLTKQDFVDHARKMEVMQTAVPNHPSSIKQLEGEWLERKKDNKYFWWSLGVDQFIHHVTHDLIVFIAIVLLVLEIL